MVFVKWTFLFLGLIVGVFVGRVPVMIGTEKVPVEPRVTKSERARSRRPVVPVEEKADEKSEPLFISNYRSPWHTLTTAGVAREISTMKGADFPGAFERAGKDERVHTLLYQRWAELNPRAAFEYLLGETDYNYLDCHEIDRPDWAFMIGSKLLQKEGKGAIPAVRDLIERIDGDSIGYNYGDTHGFEELFYQWAMVDFDSALQKWGVDEKGVFFDGVDLGIGRAAAGLGRTEELMNWLKDRPDITPWGLVERALSDWAEKDFDSALAWAERENTAFDGDSLEGVATVWVKKDVDEFLKWVSSSGRVELSRMAVAEYPDEVAAWLSKNDGGGEEWQAVRRDLLKPLTRYGKIGNEDLGRYFELIGQLQGTQDEGLVDSYVTELFHKVTWISATDPERDLPFRLHNEHLLLPYIEERGWEERYQEFKTEREEAARRLHFVREQIDELTAERIRLTHGEGFRPKK